MGKQERFERLVKPLRSKGAGGNRYDVPNLSGAINDGDPPNVQELKGELIGNYTKYKKRRGVRGKNVH